MFLKIGSLLLIGAAILIGLSSLMPDEAHNKMGVIFLSSEQKDLFSKCETLRRQLQEQNLPPTLEHVQFSIRDERLKNDPFVQDFRKCFLLSKTSPYRADVELFSSDFGKVQSHDLQVQVSIIESRTQNKVAEIGFRMDHKPMNSSASKKK